MSEILKLEPRKVMKYFYEINQIPRGSGHEKAISDYLLAFAKERKLEVLQDDALNILIRKKATDGYEKADGVILQGHMDMVCSKNADIDHDFTKDPIDMYIDEDFITARGTTLGADNGIAVAMGLAILDSDDIKHPALELFITTEEEVGLKGAIAFDGDLLQGKNFINLDSEEEGEITIGCAGGLKAIINLPINWERLTMSEDYSYKELSMRQLIGGHSGMEINLHRGNAGKLTGRILCKLEQDMDLYLTDFQSGDKDNVIPREAFAKFIIKKEDEALLKTIVDEVSAEIKAEYHDSDPNILIETKDLQIENGKIIDVFSDQAAESALFMLMCLPNGVQSMSFALEGFVESSLNMGKASVEEDNLVFWFAIRSSEKSLKHFITDQLKNFANYCKADFIQTADYPEWPVKNDTFLLNHAVSVYKSMYGKDPIVKTIHAGLECGVFLEKRPELEAISIGPNMFAVHSPDEKVSISSIQRTYEYVLSLLASLK